MKKVFLLFIPFAAMLLNACTSAIAEQSEVDDMEIIAPTNNVPSELVGGWANGFTTFTQLIEVYTGRNVGSTWQSGKYFKFTSNGKNCEFYIMGKSQYSSFATQAAGTVQFDAGSFGDSGSFTFYAIKGHYKGWGATMVDRDATASELKNNLSGKYYYRKEGDWLRIQPRSEPNEYSSSFKKTED